MDFVTAPRKPDEFHYGLLCMTGRPTICESPAGWVGLRIDFTISWPQVCAKIFQSRVTQQYSDRFALTNGFEQMHGCGYIGA